MTLLDLYCGVGGWSKVFAERGWICTGVDLLDFSSSYPCKFVLEDARNWFPRIAQFDAVVASPPCEEFARFCLPWIGRAPKVEEAKQLLRDTVAAVGNRGVVECSNFSARFVGGGVKIKSHTLWGDVPLLLPVWSGKGKISGKRPDLRAEIPPILARCVESWLRQSVRSRVLGNP